MFPAHARSMRLAIVFSLLAGFLVPELSGESVEVTATRGPLSERERICHLLDRFALGATPELVAQVEAVGIEAWFDAQLAGRGEDPAWLRDRLAKLESLALDDRAILDRYVKEIPDDAKPEERQRLERLRYEPSQELLESILLRAVASGNRVREASADFFRNHFCISIDKDSCLYYANVYERDVIRAHALGSFGQMLAASAHSPAMLVYLDNIVSRRPLSKTELKDVARRVRQETKSRAAGDAAADIAKQRGLNENYARELLELHTLGVDNGYTQRDVLVVAEALTGWTVCNEPGKPLAFMFRGELHVDGDKRLLGGTLAGDTQAPSEGERILSLLAEHPGTARFVSWKLCRAYVNDQPSEALVARIAESFRKSKGDIPTVLRAIVADPEFFARDNYRAKLKRPFELLVSALAATRARIDEVGGLLAQLGAMSEPTYRCLDPTGFYDQAEAWQDPGAMAVRWKFAYDLAMGRIPGVTIDPGLLEPLDPEHPETWKDAIVAQVLPAGISRRTSAYLDALIERKLRDNPFAPRELIGIEILGALLGSPDFQKQ